MYPCEVCGEPRDGKSGEDNGLHVGCKGPVADPIAELRRLLEKATPGPWYRACESRPPDDDYRVYGSCRPTSGVGKQDVDSRLIAAAINALPALLDCAEALEEEVITGVTRSGVRHHRCDLCHTLWLSEDDPVHAAGCPLGALARLGAEDEGGDAQPREQWVPNVAELPHEALWLIPGHGWLTRGDVYAKGLRLIDAKGLRHPDGNAEDER